MGQAGEPYYSAHGRFDGNHWVYPESRGINFNGTAYLQGGYGFGGHGPHGYPSAPHPPYENPDPNVRPDPYWHNSGTPFVFYRG
jgi:hypothetical protein